MKKHTIPGSTMSRGRERAKRLAASRLSRRKGASAAQRSVMAAKSAHARRK